MSKYLHVIRVIGDRSAKIPRYSGRGFYALVKLDEKLAEGREIKINRFGTYSDFYYAIVENERLSRKVRDIFDWSKEVAQVTDLFTVEIFPSRRNRYVRLKSRLVETIKVRGVKGIENRCFNNLKGGYLPCSGFLRFSRKIGGGKR